MAGDRARGASDGRDRAQILEELKKKLAPTAPKLRGGERPPLPTGWPALDELLGGGLPRGKVLEAAGPAGRMSLACAALGATTAGGRLAAMVDGPGALDPRALQDAGAEPERVLWCKPPAPTVQAALQVAELLLDIDGLALLVIYAVGLKGRPGAGAWLRLQQRAGAHGAAVLLLGDRPLAGSFCAATLELRAGPALWGAVPGVRSVLRGREVRAEVRRARWEGAGGTVAVRLTRP